MEKLDAHKAAMKRFEVMINTADSKLAKELVADDAPFFNGLDRTRAAAVYRSGDESVRFGQTGTDQNGVAFFHDRLGRFADML